jgi:hypothetical protein
VKRRGCRTCAYTRSGGPDIGEWKQLESLMIGGAEIVTDVIRTTAKAMKPTITALLTI